MKGQRRRVHTKVIENQYCILLFMEYLFCVFIGERWMVERISHICLLKLCILASCSCHFALRIYLEWWVYSVIRTLKIKFDDFRVVSILSFSVLPLSLLFFWFLRCKPMDGEDCEPFTDVFWIKFYRVDNARWFNVWIITIISRDLDGYCYFLF